MQEEVENKTLMLMINGTKFSGRMLKTAVSKYLAHCKEKKLQKGQVVPHGKQSVKQLAGQNQGVEKLDFNDLSVREFDRIARKYGVDYAVKRDRSSEPPKFLIFFKSRDSGALTAALEEYTQKQVHKASRPSVLQRLDSFKALLKNTVVSRDKRREQVR